MSRHVRPEKWADAFAGRLGDKLVAEMDAHAEDCPRCAQQRDRIRRSSSTFPSLRTEAAPELSWDTIRARVHWSVSSEKRAQQRGVSRRGVRFFAAGLVATGGVLAAALWTSPIAPTRTPSTAPVAVKDHAPIPVTLVSPAPAPLVGLVSRLSGQVMIDGVRRGSTEPKGNDAFERTLPAGTVIATGEGRVDVQFGADSAFSLAPRSTLELRRFDAERIELAVEGTVDLTVAPRAPGQRFFVIAGDQTVEVRGTQFRVTHDTAGTQVACRHGRVVVSDPAGTAEVATARKLAVAARAQVDPTRVAALSAAELDQLAEATPATMPMWTDAATLVQTSAALEIATVGKRAVRVDGVELGEAPLRVRVMPGRHTIETADAAGRFRRSGWVDVTAAKPARMVVQAEAAPTGGTAERRRQLHAGIDQVRLANCARAIKKAGLSSFVHIEISIDETGAVAFLNIIDTDLASSTASCVREVLADVPFRGGPAATFRDKIDL
ncbi:MAG TPA: FecR family protein [Kofleriaceae bacterium]|nr:FecR family protein [Kofleriaceae bacterium]